ncbi:LysR family transcriptional regulator [Glutamicibacter creatinolyticus]|uniref:LysR family transcriptional regulator n=1 Tax=Glutamicibacter creatinolyticus TaxID=162496 RepID=UPI003216DDCE
MLDIHRLRLLREVKLHGSMSAAARSLSYTHSAISQQLAQLERETGVRLLERVGRNVQLTAAAHELVRNTEAVLAALEKAEADLATSHQRAQGTVTIAAFASISRAVLPAALSGLASEHPGLEVRVHRYEPEEAVMRLASRQVDAVITDSFPGTGSGRSSGLHTTVLGQDPIRGYLPAGRSFISPEDIRHVPWVMEPSDSAATHWALRVCRERGFEPQIAHVSSDVLFHLRLVEHGLAAAFLPDMVMQETGSALTPSHWLPADQRRTILFIVREGSEQNLTLNTVREAVKLALQAPGPS